MIVQTEGTLIESSLTTSQFSKLIISGNETSGSIYSSVEIIVLKYQCCWTAASTCKPLCTQQCYGICRVSSKKLQFNWN